MNLFLVGFLSILVWTALFMALFEIPWALVRFGIRIFPDTWHSNVARVRVLGLLGFLDFGIAGVVIVRQGDSVVEPLGVMLLVFACACIVLAIFKLR